MASPAPAPSPVTEKGLDPACDALKGRGLSYGYGLTRGRRGDAPERLDSLEVTVHIDGSEAFQVNVRVPEGTGYASSSAANMNYPDVEARLTVEVDEQGAIRDEFTLTECGQTADQFSVVSRVSKK